MAIRLTAGQDNGVLFVRLPMNVPGPQLQPIQDELHKLGYRWHQELNVFVPSLMKERKEKPYTGGQIFWNAHRDRSHEE